jgi:hypothetical protein
VFVEMPERYTFSFFFSSPNCGEFDLLCRNAAMARSPSWVCSTKHPST